MRIGVIMCALREERLILPALHQFDGFPIEEIVVACSKKSWYGNQEGDKTAELAVRAGATVRLHDWADEKDQKNWEMEKLNYMDWIIMAAPDMYMTQESITNLLHYLDKNTTDRAVATDIVTYWKNYDTAIVPFGSFNTLAIRPNERFMNNAVIVNMSPNNPKAPGVMVHHLSWVKTDEEVKKKISTWSHSPEVPPSWYENVWLKWREGMADFNPTNPKDYKGTRNYPLPEELRDLIKKYEIK